MARDFRDLKQLQGKKRFAMSRPTGPGRAPAFASTFGRATRDPRAKVSRQGIGCVRHPVTCKIVLQFAQERRQWRPRSAVNKLASWKR